MSGGPVIRERKTWKREAAGLVLLFYWGNVTAVGLELMTATHAGLLEPLVWPVHGFAAAMFGIDWYSKQGPGARP